MEELVSIIIVNYNTEKLLRDCILSVKEKTKDVNYELVVVDNNSDANSLKSLIEEFSDIRFHLMDQNLGFGRANNVGADMAKGEYLFFLNPDTLLINNAVLMLYQHMVSNPKTGICGGNMYKGDMTPMSSYYDIDFLKLEYKIIFNKKRYPGFNYTTLPKAVNVIVGADLFIRKRLFRDFGGFDEDFFMYFEEVELCYRIQKAGYDVVSVPYAEIIHLQGGSAENKNEELKKWSYQEHWYSKMIYFSKVKGSFQTELVYFVHLLKLKIATLFYSLNTNETKLNYWKLKKDVMKKTYNRYKNYRNKKK